jgi:hypothetical protein
MRRRRVLSAVRTAGCATLLSAASLALLGSGGLAAASSAAPARPHHAAGPAHRAHPQRLRIWATYYGWFTNTPPGCTTAYLTGCAHGRGTSRDPITLASDPTEFAPGTLLYYPTVKKYFEMGDYCTTCVTSWKTSGLRQVDLWIGGEGGTEFAAINCENALTRFGTTGPVLTTFVVDPPRHLPVSRQPLFTASTGRCFGGAHSTPTYGEYQNGQSKECLADQGGGTPGTPAEVEACTKSVAGEELGFEGDFLMVDGLCLAITTAAPSATTTSGLEWTTCTGGPREQFEVGTGPIEWIQYRRCVVQTGPGAATLAMSACTGATPPDQTWTTVAQT